MLNLSTTPHHRDNPSNIELGALERRAVLARIKLPRHIAALESYQHNRQVRSSLPLAEQKRPAHRDTCTAEATNLAVNILCYQLKDTVAQQKHLENVRNNLQHRLAVAQTKQNQQLITMLQEESRQLEASK